MRGAPGEPAVRIVSNGDATVTNPPDTARRAQAEPEACVTAR